MKNFLIIVLAVGLFGAAFLTRPDREDFERYATAREQLKAGGNSFTAFFKDRGDKLDLKEVEFKDFYLWTVVKKDGRTLYTGVFDRWIDNTKVREVLPS